MSGAGRTCGSFRMNDSRTPRIRVDPTPHEPVVAQLKRTFGNVRLSNRKTPQLTKSQPKSHSLEVSTRSTHHYDQTVVALPRTNCRNASLGYWSNARLLWVMSSVQGLSRVDAVAQPDCLIMVYPFTLAALIPGLATRPLTVCS